MAGPAFFDDLAFCDQMAARFYGETVRHAPLKKGAVDPARPQTELVALVGSEGARVVTLAGGFNVGVSAEPLTIWIDTTAHPDLAVIVKDRIRLLDRPGQPWTEVATVSRKHPTLLVLTLGLVG